MEDSCRRFDLCLKFSATWNSIEILERTVGIPIELITTIFSLGN